MKYHAPQFDLLPASQTPFNLCGEIQAIPAVKPKDETPALFAVGPSFKPRVRHETKLQTAVLPGPV